MSLKKRLRILDDQNKIARAYWQVLYRDGRIVSEWDVDNWGELPKRGKVSARLVCPNGKVPTLEMKSGASIDERVFFFGISNAIQGIGRFVEAYVIGMVYGTDGQAIVYAWEPGEYKLVGPFDDHYPHMTYGGPVTASMDQLVQGVKAD